MDSVLAYKYEMNKMILK